MSQQIENLNLTGDRTKRRIMEGKTNEKNREVINGCRECGKIEELYPIQTIMMPERVSRVEYWCLGCLSGAIKQCGNISVEQEYNLSQLDVNIINIDTLRKS